MKIVTWNINSIKARKEHVLKWLESAQPDVLLLQELKGVDFPAGEFDAVGYKSAAVAQKTYNGVAILSKYDIDVKYESLPGNAGDDQARYIEADIEGVRVIGIYAPNGNPVDSDKFSYKLAWLEFLKTRMSDLLQEELPFVVGGDFNIIPEDKDCYNPKAWENDALFRPESRRIWREFINMGLTDAFRVYDHRPGRYTFWDYQGGAWQNGNGIRIDHFLLSPAMADRLKKCEIDSEPRGWNKASDHTPLIAAFG